MAEKVDHEIGDDEFEHDADCVLVGGPGPTIECAICLQNCVYPVVLPCKHIFCFLCVKGVTLQSKKCAMCRREIPHEYLYNPELINKEDTESTQAIDSEYQWFYQGRNGWWQYDHRTSMEIEKYHKDGCVRCELLIAGFLYIIDFEHMFQYRRNDPSRRRKVKRDIATGPKKGVAGLRIGVEAEVDSDNVDQIDFPGDAGGGTGIATSSRAIVTSADSSAIVQSNHHQLSSSAPSQLQTRTMSVGGQSSPPLPSRSVAGRLSAVSRVDCNTVFLSASPGDEDGSTSHSTATVANRIRLSVAATDYGTDANLLLATSGGIGRNRRSSQSSECSVLARRGSDATLGSLGNLVDLVETDASRSGSPELEPAAMDQLHWIPPFTGAAPPSYDNSGRPHSAGRQSVLVGQLSQQLHRLTVEDDMQQQRDLSDDSSII